MGFVPLKPHTAWRRCPFTAARARDGTAPQQELSPGSYEASWQNYRLGAGRTVQTPPGSDNGQWLRPPADSVFWGGTGCQSRILTSNLAGSSRHRHNSPLGAHRARLQARLPKAVSNQAMAPSPNGTHNRQAMAHSRSGTRINGALSSPASQTSRGMWPRRSPA